jgi:hypothetical protein
MDDRVVVGGHSEEVGLQVARITLVQLLHVLAAEVEPEIAVAAEQTEGRNGDAPDHVAVLLELRRADVRPRLQLEVQFTGLEVRLVGRGRVVRDLVLRGLVLCGLVLCGGVRRRRGRGRLREHRDGEQRHRSEHREEKECSSHHHLPNTTPDGEFEP